MNRSAKRGAVLTLSLTLAAAAAPVDRIRSTVDARQTRTVAGNVHRLAQTQYDQGPVDPAQHLDHIVLLFKPSAAQQADLDQLLSDQQNPSSPHFHQWLTPEAYGNRFGLSPGDHSKVAAWLASEGLAVQESGRGRNWVAFGGSAAQVSKSLHTALHRYRVNGENHFANNSAPAVPEALADVVGGFIGLDDFYPKPFAMPVSPAFTSGNSHFLVPEDYATIYDIAPLYQAGIDGTGQSIAVVGQSDVLLSDIRAFRTKYNLPANDPKMVPYSSTDPGFNGAQVEGNLDLEWAGAIAPGATIYYIYGPNAFTAIVAAVNLNTAQIVSVSYGSCEVNASIPFYRSVLQQANAQGMTVVAASGDSGAAGCDSQGSEPLATRGLSVDIPAAFPEVTGVGGTQFVEGTGSYWASTNTKNLGSALSYIPEAGWNESSSSGLASAGGGVSRLYGKPVWQSGPGVPNDNARDVPDISMSASTHDGYEVYVGGTTGAVGGTSAPTPAMAGVVALLNHYLVKNGLQSQPGLGNLNPQLYRLAQSAPAAFHDTVSGDNRVPCAQSGPDCASGVIGYPTGSGYDMVTGLGSLDVNAIATQWNSPAVKPSVQLSSSAAKGTLNDTVTLTATVTGPSGSPAPTGSIAFSSNGIPLGSMTVNSGTATVQAPLYVSGTGTFIFTAAYSGDSVFSTGGATTKIQVTTPTGVAAIVPTAPNAVWPSFPDAQGPMWQTTLALREAAGTAAMITGFTIDGVTQSLSKYFPAPTISAGGTVSSIVTFRNVAAPLSHTFGFTGVDVTGANWSRQVAVTYMPMPESQNFTLMATPLVIAQNPSADPSCQWPVQLNIDDQGGFLNVLSGFFVGGANAGNNLASQIVPTFGTTRLDAWDGLQGTYCFSGVTPGEVSNIEVDLSGGLIEQLTVSFTGPPANPTKLTATPATLSLTSGSSAPAQTTLAVGIADKTQAWTATVFPANRSTAWLTLSQVSGTGPGQITLTASGAGYEPGSYRATIVLQSPNATPQYVNVPVMFVNGGSASAPGIAAIANVAAPAAGGSPGELMTVYGTNLAGSTATAAGFPLPYSLGGVTATVNGMPAPLLYVSPTQINLQIPYSAGAGPAVVGVTNKGLGGGFQFTIAASAPAIYLNSDGSVAGANPVKQGDSVTLYVNGIGEVSPALKSAYSPSGPVAGLPRPVLPLSATVGGVPCFVTFAGISPGLIGTAQVNVTIPVSVATGIQPVVVTVGGVASPAGTLMVLPAQ